MCGQELRIQNVHVEGCAFSSVTVEVAFSVRGASFCGAEAVAAFVLSAIVVGVDVDEAEQIV